MRVVNNTLENQTLNSKEIDILFQDPDLVCVNKPSGLLTIPDGYHPNSPHLRTVLEPILGRIWIVHRLDKETSGALILARSPDAHKQLSIQFEQRNVHKQYHAIVFGSPSWDYIDIDLPLSVNGDRHHRTIPGITGKAAFTGVRILERWHTYSLVEASPRTGYTHQIRAHLAAMGYPILGDYLYGFHHSEIGYSQTLIPRVALHASTLNFIHPTTSSPISIFAPYPSDFQEAINQIRSN